MKKTRVTLSFLIVILALTLLTTVRADTITTAQNFDLDFDTGDSFAVQDVTQDITFTFTVTTGNLTGSGSLETSSTGGTLIITSTTVGSLNVSATASNYTFYHNDAVMVGTLIGFATTQFSLSWIYPTTGDTTLPEVLNITPFWQYLFNGDLLGFLQGIFLLQFLVLDILVGALLMLVLVPIYLRTKSLILICIIWILLGAVFITAVPALSGLAVVFLILGLGGIFWRLVKRD